MPACYTTAVQSLIDVGQLEKGQVRRISCSSAIHPSRYWEQHTVNLDEAYLFFLANRFPDRPGTFCLWRGWQCRYPVVQDGRSRGKRVPKDLSHLAV